MSNWPPNPNKQPNQPPHSPQPQQPTGQEWRLLEKTLMASIEEQRRARRWSIFFKLLTFGYILLMALVLGRGCTPDKKQQAFDGIDTSKPHLAVIDVQGVISRDKDANAYDINKALTKAFENPNSKAVALNINSPGGSPVQSDEIWQRMMELRKKYPDKKLYAVIGDIGASGAYYIASGADEIWVNPSSLVGSIGVILPSYNVEGLMDKVGVKDRTITAGKYKDILSMSRPLTDYEKEHVQNVLNNTHQHFINAVKEGRGDRLKNPEENQLFTGLFWSGEQSIELGLADQRGGIQSLEAKLKLDNAVNYTPTDPWRQMLDHLSLQMGKGIGSSIQIDVTPKEDKEVYLR